MVSDTKTLHLLDVDPDLGRGIDPSEWQAARRFVLAGRLGLVPGPWDWEATAPPTAFGASVVSGMLLREHVLNGRVSAMVLGPGDYVEAPGVDRSSVPDTVRWTAHGPVTLAVLDDRVVAATRYWPVLTLRLTERLAAQQARLFRHAAVLTIPRVELRILAVLWMLADVWGRVTPAGILVPVRCTHETLGRIVGAQRSTVSLALTLLAEQGSVTRREDGSYLLGAGSEDLLLASGNDVLVSPPPAQLAPAGGTLARRVRGPERHYRADPQRDVAIIGERFQELRRSLPLITASVGATVERSRQTVTHSEDTRARVQAGREARRLGRAVRVP